jgi:protein-disulfide isomerase
MIEFSDFECPFCSRFATDVMPSLKTRYVDTGMVRVGFRHLPLSMHARAQRAAESAECAARQGKFWEMHNELFTAPMRLEERDLTAHAERSGVDLAAFSTCMKGSASSRVKADAAMAASIGLMGTPAFVIGTVEAGTGLRASEVVVGARPLADFSAALDRALAGS